MPRYTVAVNREQGDSSNETPQLGSPQGVSTMAAAGSKSGFLCAGGDRYHPAGILHDRRICM
jgi:hypothetical protein